MRISNSVRVKIYTCLFLLFQVVPATLLAQVIREDSIALVNIYNLMDGPNWIDKSGWLTDRVGNWHGIAIENNRVTELDLSANGVDGKIPASIGQLSHVQVLSFINNQLWGEIPPEIGDIDSLRILLLSKNRLEGTIPGEIGQLASLDFLAIAANDLVGPLPPELGQLSNLTILDLFDNLLDGEIPPEIGDMASLRLMFLNTNRLTGEIPAELGRLDRLISMYLSRNFLEEIPDGLADMDSLQILDLSANSFNGPLNPAIGGFKQLEILWLFNNQFDGPLPDSLAALTRLEQLNISNTNFSGSLPLSFTSLQALSNFNFFNTALCIPGNQQLMEWLDSVSIVSSTNLNCQATSLANMSKIPDAFTLEQNYPNPGFRDTRIRYGVPSTSVVQVALFDVQGRRVKTVFEGTRDAGWYELNIDLNALPAGIYWYKLESQNFSKTRSLIAY